MIVRLLADVPLAEHSGRVSGRFQRLRQDDAVQRQIRLVVDRSERAPAPVEAIRATHGVDARAGRILPAHQRRPRRRAILVLVEVGEFRALAREAVDVRRLVILAAKAGDVGIAEIVGHDEDQVGPRGHRGPGRQDGQQAQGSTEDGREEGHGGSDPWGGRDEGYVPSHPKGGRP